MRIEEVVVALHQLGAICFGKYTLKSGIEAPIYIDLRLIISAPSLVKAMGELLWQKMEGNPFDRVVGVPYTALPLASYISLQYQLPMLMKRKEAKSYGTKKLIEGHYLAGESCVIIEDVITSGASLLETAEPLENEGLKINKMLSFLDREQGGRLALEKKGYQVDCVITLTEMAQILVDEKRLTPKQQAEIGLML